MQESELQFIKSFLSLDDSLEQKYDGMRSTFKLALLAAREQGGRDLKEGTYDDQRQNEQLFIKYPDDYLRTLGHSASPISSMLLYFIVLEQLGDLFKKSEDTSVDQCKHSGIRNAVFSFSEIKKDSDLNALYGMRCSFVHNFGLCTENTRQERYRFSLSFTEKDLELIQHSTRKWDGDYSNKSKDNLTEISCFKFQDLAENIYTEVKKLLETNSLTLIPSMEELKSRYIIVAPK